MRKPGSRLVFLELDATRSAAALNELLAGLVLASQNLEADRRQGWLDALKAVYQFLYKLNPNDEGCMRVPIATLMQALQDLDQGTVDPGLAARRRPGGQQSGYDRVALRALAAAALDLLIKLGDKKPEAGMSVARALNELGVPIGNSRNSSIEQAGKTVAKWRERIEEGDDQKAVEGYKSLKELFKKNVVGEGNASGLPPNISVDDIKADLPKFFSEVLGRRI